MMRRWPKTAGFSAARRLSSGWRGESLGAGCRRWQLRRWHWSWSPGWSSQESPWCDCCGVATEKQQRRDGKKQEEISKTRKKENRLPMVACCEGRSDGREKIRQQLIGLATSRWPSWAGGTGKCRRRGDRTSGKNERESREKERLDEDERRDRVATGERRKERTERKIWPAAPAPGVGCLCVYTRVPHVALASHPRHTHG